MQEPNQESNSPNRQESSMETNQRQTTNLPAIPPGSTLDQFSAKPVGQCASNIPMDTIKGKELIVALEAGHFDWTVDDWPNKTFSLSMFHMQWVHDVNGRDGELTSFVRTCCVMPDGKVLKFGSGGVADSMRSIIRTFGFGPYDPPLNLEIRKMKARNGYRIVLIPVNNEREVTP